MSLVSIVLFLPSLGKILSFTKYNDKLFVTNYGKFLMSIGEGHSNFHHGYFINFRHLCHIGGSVTFQSSAVFWWFWYSVKNYFLKTNCPSIHNNSSNIGLDQFISVQDLISITFCFVYVGWGKVKNRNGSVQFS